MGSTKGYYGLIQYCPDPSKAEAANVGVMLFCPDLGYIDALTSGGNDRARRFFRGESFDKARLNAVKKSLEERIRGAKDSISSLEDLRKFIDTRANELRITPPRSVKVENPEEELQSLFRELVGGRSHKDPRRVDLPELDAALHGPQFFGKVLFDQRFKLPILGKEMSVPYTFKNGALNLIKPQKFSERDDAATNVAMRLAVEGDILQTERIPAEQPKKLTVITVFDENHVSNDLRHRVVGILDRYRVRTVERSNIPALIKEIEQTAH